MHDTESNSGNLGLSRRTFLGVAASIAGGGWRAQAQGGGELEELRVPLGTPRSRVVQISAEEVVNGAIVHRSLLQEMLGKLLITVTGRPTEAAAWRSLLKPDDVIGLKFNRSGQGAIGTTNALADVLVGSIVRSGWQPEQIVCIEVPDHVQRRNGTAPPWSGFSEERSVFASGSDQLASVLDQVTALISVPFLKTHNIAGLTCSLKNLSHAMVKHPARFHRDGCSPFVGDIVALPAIRDKLRLCIVDAMRVVFDGGPTATTTTVSDEGVLLASLDPVAVDAIALEVLNDIRRRRGLAIVAEDAAHVPYLRAAHEAGVGIAVAHGIEHIVTRP